MSPVACVPDVRRTRRKATQPAPFLWVGGKSRVIPAITRVLNERRWLNPPYALVEAFTGSAAFSLSLLTEDPEQPTLTPLPRPTEVLLCDAVTPLLRTYRTIREIPSEVITCLRVLRGRVGGDLSREGYASIRAELNERIPGDGVDPALAAAFLVTNWSGYNGLWRTNREGRNNVPWGKWTLARDWDVMERQVHRTSADLRRTSVTFHPWDARDRGVVSDPIAAFLVGRPADAAPVLVYVDSPYPGTYSGYAGPWTPDDFVTLRHRLLRWHDLGARLLISFPAGHDELLPSWPSEPVEVPDLVGHTAASRGVRAEILMTSPERRA